MVTQWGLTIDCAHPKELAKFWSIALGYQEKLPPPGCETWEQWFARNGIPEAEWDDGAYLADPDGKLPNLAFLKVPESKVVKNRLHLDVQAGGGRAIPWDERWPRVMEAKEELIAIGATVLQQHDLNGKPDHFVMADPEGNEFCLL